MRVHDYLEYWADLDPGRPCVSDGQRSLTYGELNGLADGIAAALCSLGVAPGDRFAVLGKNCLEWIAIYYGAFKAGAIPVPLNFRLHASEWLHVLGDSDARGVLAQSGYAEALNGIRVDLPPTVRELLVFGGEMPGWTPLAAVVEKAPALSLDAPITAQHELWQMYTSGTTGRPKGAVLTHAAVDANLMQLRTAMATADGDRKLVVLPLFHAAGILSTATSIAAGGWVRILPEFDATEFVRLLDEEAITCTTMVPAMIQAALAVPGVQERKYSALSTIAYGGSPIAAPTLRTAMATFGCDFVQVFGQTEASGGLTALDPRAHRRAAAGEEHLLGSCGRPLLGTQIAIVDSEGKPLPVGEPGEIVARGPQVMQGYWNRPEATAAALTDGWLHTGDIGRMDDDGYLYLCDRLKDMIVSGAENIYPREVEDVLQQMPGVAEAAVIGVPDERWGETVKAVVVPIVGADITEEAVIDWCRARLATFKSPRSIDLRDELPRNATGKVLKNVLREPYWIGHERRIG